MDPGDLEHQYHCSPSMHSQHEPLTGWCGSMQGDARPSCPQDADAYKQACMKETASSKLHSLDEQSDKPTAAADSKEG